nr:hypothetical protein CFP56_03100 [Quercus suber]
MLRWIIRRHPTGTIRPACSLSWSSAMTLHEWCCALEVWRRAHTWMRSLTFSLKSAIIMTPLRTRPFPPDERIMSTVPLPPSWPSFVPCLTLRPPTFALGDRWDHPLATAQPPPSTQLSGSPISRCIPPRVFASALDPPAAWRRSYLSPAPLSPDLWNVDLLLLSGPGDFLWHQ